MNNLSQTLFHPTVAQARQNPTRRFPVTKGNLSQPAVQELIWVHTPVTKTVLPCLVATEERDNPCAPCLMGLTGHSWALHMTRDGLGKTLDFEAIQRFHRLVCTQISAALPYC
jgi:hypothetical protein